MPIFEYICKECDHQFETLVYGKQKAECPKCHGSKLAPQLSVFAVSAKGRSQRRTLIRRLRFLRRPARSGIVLAAQYELMRSAYRLMYVRQVVIGVTTGTTLA